MPTSLLPPTKSSWMLRKRRRRSAVTCARRGLSAIAHWWQLWQQHYAVHEAKAKRLRAAQSAFFLFLFLLTLFGVAVGVVVPRCA